MRATPLLFAALALGPGPTAAQPAPCFPAESVDPWVAESVDAPTGAARPLTGGLDPEVELCSVSDGPGEFTDSYQAAVRGVAGDVTVEATVVELDPAAQAGLVFAQSIRTTGTAQFHVVAERLGPGPEVVVSAAVRPVQGGPSTPLDGLLVDAVLPVTLRLTRAAGVISATVVADANGPVSAPVLALPVAGTDLAQFGAVGLLQAGADLSTPATARFAAPSLSVAFVPPPVVECTDAPVVPSSGAQIALAGFALDHVTAARLGAVPLSIERTAETGLLLSVPPAPVPLVGEVFLTAAGRERATGRVFATGGTPWVRGDVDGDGAVDTDDLTALRRHVRRGTLPDCRQTADVNADGRVDAADDTQLARWVNGRRGAVPPAAPFPVAGVVPGTPACGLAPGPVVRRLLRPDGTTLTGTLQTGDVVVVAGTNLPVAPTVRFGPVHGTVLPGATSTRAQVRLGQVPAGGAHCLVVGAPSSAPDGSSARFGPAYAATPAERPDLCPVFAASRADFATVGLTRDDGSIFLPFEPARFDPERRVRISVDLAWPLVDGEGRGPRSASFWYEGPPRAPGDTAPVTYDAWLSALAKQTAAALGAGDDCDCEAEVLPEPALGGLSIRPCHQTAPVPPAPPPPAGTVPGGLPLKPVKPSPGAAHAFAPPPAPSCDDLGPDASALRRGWCAFAEVTAPRESYDPDDVDDHIAYLGLPVWEGFLPASVLSPGGPAWVIDPREQPASLKRVKVEPRMANRLQSAGYFEACAIAARSHHCGNLSASWMPHLPVGSRIVKAFWQPQGGLPASANPDAFYSWVPPAANGAVPQRLYLVGMHVSESTGQSAGNDGYLTWGTYWYPVAPGETHTKDGRSIDDVYNPSCFVGGASERPAALAGTPYENWHACVQAGSKGKCGNPWGPRDECEANLEEDLGCVGCHIAAGTIALPEGANNPDEPWMAMGWLTLPGYLAEDVQACMSVILDQEAKGKAPYESLADCEDF
jgi:hypothetical protein